MTVPAIYRADDAVDANSSILELQVTSATLRYRGAPA